MSTIVLGYIGPETMLPLTSVAAGAVGVSMMFGRRVVHGVRRVLRLRPTPSKSAHRRPGSTRGPSPEESNGPLRPSN